METAWESQLAGLLTELSATQGELLDVLAQKRKFMMAADSSGMQSLEPREREILERLQACQQRRGELLERAKSEGLPSDSIRALATALPAPGRQELAKQVNDAANRSRLLQHQSLTNWVLVQRTLLHLSQLLEILATGGRLRPTYGKCDSACASGSFLDRAA